jgi:hypothetical protein
MDTLIREKVFSDIAMSSLPLHERQPTSFASFLFDQLLVRYGLYPIMCKILMQLMNSLRA